MDPSAAKMPPHSLGWLMVEKPAWGQHLPAEMCSVCVVMEELWPMLAEAGEGHRVV